MNLFTKSPRRKRSHGHRHYTSPKMHDVSIDGLLPFMNKPLGLHHIRTKLYSLPFTTLHSLYRASLDTPVTDPSSPLYRLVAIILDIGHHRLFKPVGLKGTEEEKRSFLPIPFINKGIDAINLANILNHKNVTSKIPPYFKGKSITIISYSYTQPIASTIFNYRKVLQNLKIDDFKAKPPDCSCHNSPFNYSHSGHVITGDLNIVENESLRNILAKGPKYREPQPINWNYNFKILMDAVEDYARKWIKREKEDELDSLSEWVKAVRSLILKRTRSLSGSMNTHATSIFKDPDVAKTLSTIHDKYVVVPADKAQNNIVFICKKYYIECLLSEVDQDKTNCNQTYKETTLSKQEIIDNHKSALSFFNVPLSDDDCDLPSMHWIPKLHKNPYKQRFIAGSAKCTTKPLSKLLASILTTVKKGLQSYYDTCYSRSGINSMWILKNSKDLLDDLNSRSLSKYDSIKTFDFSTLYTTLPHKQLKTRLKEIIHRCFSKKDGTPRYKYIVIGWQSSYFVKEESKSTSKYTEEEIIKMLEFLIDNIFVQCGGRVYQQTIGIPMGTNCAPLLADLFLHSYEADFIADLIKKNEKHLARSFNLSFRYIDDVLSLNNPRFGDYLDNIYPKELEIKDTTDSAKSASYLDLLLEIDEEGKLMTKLYDKRDDFSFQIVNFPFLCGNIPSAPAYGVYISQLIRYARACRKYTDFVYRAKLLTDKLLKQGYVVTRLRSSLQKFYGRHHELVDKYGVAISKMRNDLFPLS